MIIIQEVIYMNKISRRDRFRSLNTVDKSLESIESLNELIILYQIDIQGKLDNITKNVQLQKQLKHALGITW